MKLFKHVRINMGLLACIFSQIMLTYEETILTVHLESHNLTLAEKGLYFSLLAITYVPMSILVTKIPKKVERRVLITLALFVIGLAFTLVGPS